MKGVQDFSLAQPILNPLNRIVSRRPQAMPWACSSTGFILALLPFRPLVLARWWWQFIGNIFIIFFGDLALVGVLGLLYFGAFRLNRSFWPLTWESVMLFHGDQISFTPS